MAIYVAEDGYDRRQVHNGGDAGRAGNAATG
jgi:hypothetical protein